MARSTPTEASRTAAAIYHHSAQQQYHSSQSVATTILKRHTSQRQRFDSADHVLCEQLQRAAAAKSPLRLQVSGGRAPDEHEPEPEAAGKSGIVPPSPGRLAVDTSSPATSGSVYPQQHVRRIRLQRFDSADWVMESQLSRSSPRGSPRSPTTQTGVAKLLLDRHAYTTCQFVTTPVESKSQRCAEKA